MGLIKKCLACHKTLVDEVLPLCSRCQRQGFRKAKKGGMLAAATAVLIFGIKNAAENKSKED